LNEKMLQIDIIADRHNEENNMNTKICEQCEWYKTEGNYKDIHGKNYDKRICMRLTCPKNN